MNSICLHQMTRLAEPAIDINILYICTTPPVECLVGVTVVLKHLSPLHLISVLYLSLILMTF